MGGTLFEIMGASRRSGGLRGLGALTEYDSVLKLQLQLNIIVGLSGALPTAACRIRPTYTLGTDRKYGRRTHATLKKVADFVAQGCHPSFPGGGSSWGTGADVQRNGPSAVSGMLGDPIAGSFSDSEIAELQQAWREWKTAGSPAVSSDDVPPADAPPTDDAPAGSDAGWSTGTWVAVIGGSVAAAALLAWLLLRKKGR